MATRTFEKKPLYRRVNTKTHNVRHGNGGEYKWSRNAKDANQKRSRQGAMNSKHRHGLDYTPLFKFLLSRVGKSWPKIHSEAVARLDKPDPIFWLVANSDAERVPYHRVGESSYYSGLYIDEDNNLALVDPTLTVEDMKPSCSCCTHTFNGAPFTQMYNEG